MNTTTKIYLFGGLFLSLTGSLVLLSFIYSVVYDEETVEILTSMDSTKRIFVISLVLLGVGLLCYQGNNFMEMAIEKGSRNNTEVMKID